MRAASDARSLAKDASPPGPPSAGPRFALRFEDGRGRLTLAQRHRFALGTVERLELDLGRLRFPLDLSRGPLGFRARRTRVLAAELRLDPLALLAHVEEPYAIRVLAPRPDGALLAVRDAFGTLAVHARARFDGPALSVVLDGARAAAEGPAPPLARALVAMRALGLTHEPASGRFILRGALSALLREALVPHGWRMPDDRSVRVSAELRGARELHVRTLPEGEEASLLEPERFETALRLAPVVAALARGDHEEAARALDALRERGLASEAVAREAAALGLGDPSLAPSGEVGDAPALAASLRAALRAADVDAAARHAEDLAEVEPCDEVAVEALSAAAELAPPRRAAELLARAVARRPSDLGARLRLVEMIARQGPRERLDVVVAEALRAQDPGPARAEIARAAATVCELAGQHEVARELYRRAAEHLPNDAAVLEGLARGLERAADPAAALDAWDRAARSHAEDGREPDAARALVAAARCARAASRLDVAEERLARAARAGAVDAEILAALALVRRALGAREAATRAEDRLLEASATLGPAQASADVVRALAEAAETACGAGEGERARGFAGALRRTDPEHPALAALFAAIDALEADDRIARPEALFDLSATALIATLARTDDPRALLREAHAARGDQAAARAVAAAARATEAPALLHALAALGADVLAHVDDADVLLTLAPHVPSDADKIAIYIATSALLKTAGRAGEAALARARAGAAKRDTAMLRAALTAAEDAGDTAIALEIVELALTVVGQGPARRALESVRARLTQ